MTATTQVQRVWSVVQTYTSETAFSYATPVLQETIPAETAPPPSDPDPDEDGDPDEDEDEDEDPDPDPDAGTDPDPELPPPPPVPDPEPAPDDCTLVAPYWSRSSGGFVVAPEPGRTSVSVECGLRTTEYEAENGLVVRLVRNRCARTGLRITGAAPGGWYWQHGDRNAAVAPLVCSESLGRVPAVVPGGVTVDATDTATWISHDTARLVGIVPHFEANQCSEYVTPYWHGHGGIVARPTAGRTGITVRVQCGIWSTSQTFPAGEDGVVSALVRKDHCMDQAGNPREGRLTVKGVESGGWYWISGERNAAVAPLVCSDLLDGPATMVPIGVRYRRARDGTFFRHDADRLIGVVPHLEPVEN